jgi:hypothetical protein
MTQPQQVPVQCVEREEIAESIRAVMSRIIHLHNAESEALKKHDLRELERISVELEKASACESSLLEKF